MARLFLERASPLTQDERSALPEAMDTVPAPGSIASVPAPEDPADLVALAVCLARAVPDARVGWLDTALAAPPASPPDPALPPPLPPTGPLDTEGRESVRRLLQSTDPEEAVQGCRRAQAAGWRSAVTLLKRLLSHSDTRVRLAAIDGLEALAGPGLVPALRRLEADPSEAVRAAAVRAIGTLDS